jgi:hypothetical protein
MSDAIIVLGRGVEQDGTLPPDPKSRVRKAVELFQQGEAPFIIMSGAWTYHAGTSPRRSEAAAMKEYAESLGVPPEKIIEECDSKDTIGNVYFTKKNIYEPKGWHSLTIVASDEHMSRIEYLFHKIFGPQYSFRFINSERVIDDNAYARETIHEQQSMATTKKWLDPLKAGDDKSLWQLLVTKHPAYSLQTHEKKKPSDKNSQDLVAQLRVDLLKSRKARDQLTATTLQTLLSAIDNANAVPVSENINTSGVGSTEAPRRILSAQDIAAIVTAEITELKSAINELDDTRSSYRDELNSRIGILERFL